ncbi:MAG: esterase/lipase family protein [Byssovorax cruenta]
MDYIPPVIVVPGITGTYLRDDYQLPPDRVWGLIEHDYVRVALHPDDPRFEALEPARVRADSIFEVAYKEIIQELRYNLCPSEDEPVPVFPFAYDWRLPLAMIEKQFADFIDEVIARTKLIRHYMDKGYGDNPTVNLIGHSMGGLIITGYLDTAKRDARVSKVVTLATPYKGSFEAVIKIATGTANLGTDSPQSREREAARLTASLYHLLPEIQDAIEVDDPSLPTSFFSPGLWQHSVVQSVLMYVQKRMAALNQEEKAQELFAKFLEAAHAYRTRIDNFDLAETNLQTNDWLCVVGVNSNTRVRMRISNVNGAPLFDLSSKYRLNEWRKDKQNPTAWRWTGDGTVPFEAALPNFLPLESIVCVTPDDYGYWEIQDRLAAGVAGFHAIICNMDMLHRMIVRHFTGRPDMAGNTWGYPAPGVNARDWKPPIAMRSK